MQFKSALVSGLFAALALGAATPDLEKRCTADGGSCTQLSQCCSGNCEYDSAVGLVCRPARKFMEKRCTANGGSCTQLSQCCSGNCEYDSSIGLVCKA